jgi:hypothetical protein
MCVSVLKGARTQNFRKRLIFLGWMDAARQRGQGQYNCSEKLQWISHSDFVFVLPRVCMYVFLA